MKNSNEWYLGDKFTTPETGSKVFVVCKVDKWDVCARDVRSRAGFTVFSKSWITKVEDANLSQTDIEINKFDSIEKIVKQLEGCNYECEAGYLKNNVAFMALKKNG